MSQDGLEKHALAYADHGAVALICVIAHPVIMEVFTNPIDSGGYSPDSILHTLIHDATRCVTGGPPSLPHNCRRGATDHCHRRGRWYRLPCVPNILIAQSPSQVPHLTVHIPLFPSRALRRSSQRFAGASCHVAETIHRNTRTWDSRK